MAHACQRQRAKRLRNNAHRPSLMHHPSQQELLNFENFFTPLVSDVMDRLGISSHVLSREIQSIPFDPSLKVVGLAFPCRVIPTSEYVEITKLLEMVDS